MIKKNVILKLTDIFREIFNNQDIILDIKMTAKDIDNWDSLTHMILIDEI